MQPGAIDLPRRNHLNGDPRRGCQDRFEEPLPLPAFELLRVVQEPERCRPAAVEPAVVEEDAGRYEGPGETSPSRLVDASHETDAEAAPASRPRPAPSRC